MLELNYETVICPNNVQRLSYKWLKMRQRKRCQMLYYIVFKMGSSKILLFNTKKLYKELPVQNNNFF
jgi:hypothetical protein